MPLSEQEEMDKLIAELDQGEETREPQDSSIPQNSSDTQSDNDSASIVNHNAIEKKVIEPELNEKEPVDDFEPSNGAIDSVDAEDSLKPLKNKQGDEKNDQSEPTENKKSIKQKYKIFSYRLVWIITPLFILACFFGWFFYYKKNSKFHSDQILKETANYNKTENAHENHQFKSNKKLHKQTNKPSIKKCLEKIENQILFLNKKLNRIEGLKEYYKKGIADIVNIIAKEKNKKKIVSYEEAIKNKKIELSLRTIQRREAYMEQLKYPNNQLKYKREKILYLKRKTLIEVQIAPISSGIDLNQLQDIINSTIKKQISDIDMLIIDTKNLKLKPLVSVWENTIKQSHSMNNNVKINQEICQGNLKKINNVTFLSLKAAKCLSKWEGKDILLNNITILFPDIAKELAKWEGDWLCLNGLEKLPPETAKYLFQWKGKKISINGVTELSDETARYIFGWKGKELEIIGLKKFSPAAAEHINSWRKLGGKIYISDLFYKNRKNG